MTKYNFKFKKSRRKKRSTYRQRGRDKFFRSLSSDFNKQILNMPEPIEPTQEEIDKMNEEEKVLNKAFLSDYNDLVKKHKRKLKAIVVSTEDGIFSVMKIVKDEIKLNEPI